MSTTRPMPRIEKYGQRGSLRNMRLVGGLTRSGTFVRFEQNICIGCQLYSVYPKTRGRDTAFTSCVSTRILHQVVRIQISG